VSPADPSKPAEPARAADRSGAAEPGHPAEPSDPARHLALAAYLAQRRRRIEAALEAWLTRPPADDPVRLHEAIRYAVLGGGKRLRPILALAAHDACGGADPPAEAALRAACAVELLHCYSLVHDDLPAMDNDDLRRGRASLHRAFGEATAILTGDALLTLSFEWAAAAGPAVVRTLAQAAGPAGMIVGQARDLALEHHTPTLDELEQLFAEKTGALFAAAAAIGALCAHADLARVQALGEFGRALGIAFQCADDRDDAEHESLRTAVSARAGTRLAQTGARLRELGVAANPLVELADQIGRHAAG